MSKKNRYKFRDRPSANTSNEGSAVANTPRSSSADGAMAQHVAEYRIISKDLIRLVLLNGFMLAAVLVLYFTNRNNGYLERMFQNLF